MLLEQNALYMGEVSDLTLNQIKEICFERFASDLKYELIKKRNSEKGTVDSFVNESIFNYGIFEKRYGKKISFNNKNISYKETFTDLKCFCGNYYGLVYSKVHEKDRTYDRWELPSIDIKLPPELTCKSDTDIEECKSLINFDKFFGKGEFPFMVITLLRLGNQDYYFAQITR